MVKQHLKRIAMPKTWPINRKENMFITRPLPGGQPQDKGVSINTAMKLLAEVTKTTKETKKVLNNKEILIDGKRIKEHRRQMGIMDVLAAPEVKKQWRMTFTSKGKLTLIEIDEKESKMKLCQIKNKSAVTKGKIQLHLHDGKNIMVEKDTYKTGDTIAISVPEQKITDHIKLEKGVTIMLTGGKKIGTVCKLEEIKENIIIAKKDDNVFETLKKFAFVLGKDKPMIKTE